jgi:hypothetical protein
MRRTLSFGIALAMVLAGCQQPPGSGLLTQALGDGGGAQFENPPVDDSDPFASPMLPPAVSARMHSCQKIPYVTLGRLLGSRGVNLNAVAGNGQPPTAGQLYKAGSNVLGAPDYAARVREAVQPTTSAMTRLMDIYLAAAPEIIAAMPSLKTCSVKGAAVHMFDPQTGSCTPEGIACLVGAPAVQAQIDLCNQLITDIPGKTGQQIAVGAILSAAHSCE